MGCSLLSSLDIQALLTSGERRSSLFPMSILHGFWSLYKQTREVFSHKSSFQEIERIRGVDVSLLSDISQDISFVTSKQAHLM
jgi:hypothetical protein